MFHLEDNHLDQALKSCKRAFLYVVFFGLVVSFLTLATSIYSLQVFDRVLSSGSYETLIGLTLIMVIFSALLNFVQGIRTSILHEISTFLDQKLSALIIDLSFVALKKEGFAASPSANIKELSTIRNFISSQYFILAIDAPWSLVYMFVIFLIHYWLGVIIVIGALLLLFLSFVNNVVTKRLSAKVNEISTYSVKDLDIIGRNVEVVEAMHMKKNLINSWEEINHKLLKQQADLNHKSNIISNLTKFFRGMIYVATVTIGAVLVVNSKMSSGGIVACSILSAKALAPFDAAISLWHSFLSTTKSYQKLKRLIKEHYVEEKSIVLPEAIGDVVIDKLTYTPPKSQKPIIRGVNIKIDAGDIVAIIGPTAAGKSTLAKLIAGISQPSSGSVRLDNADIRNWKSEQLAQYIGYLPQDIELFNGDVKTNIARMDKKAEDEKVIKAAQMAHAHDMILQFSKGYETDIGAWGMKISAGQRQRIGLARAFFGNPKLLILDEPNSNLDQEGELALSLALKEAKKNKITVIAVSHRPNIMEVVDKILVMVNGEAKFFGKRDEVLAQLRAQNGVQAGEVKQNA